MAIGLVDRLFAFGRIVASKVSGKANAVLVNLTMFDDAGEGLEEDEAPEEAAEEPFFGTAGVYCRPDAPTSDGYCEVMALRLADGARPVAARDLRLNARVNPKEGELGLAHYGGGFVSLKWNDDHKGTTLTAMAPVLKPGSGGVLGDVDKSHSLTMDTAASNNAIVLAHMEGMSITMIDGELTLSGSKKNWIRIDQAEILLNGVVKLFGGVVAGNPQTALEVALAPPLLAWTTEVQTALIKIAALLNAPGPVQGAPGAVTPPVAVPTIATAGSKTLKASLV